MKVSYNKDVAAQDHKWKKRHYIDDDKSTCTDYIVPNPFISIFEPWSLLQNKFEEYAAGGQKCIHGELGTSKTDETSSRRHIIHVYTTYIAVV